MQPIERWRPVVGYEGLYEVSDQGSVRSFQRPGPPYLLASSCGDGPYLRVALYRGRRRTTIRIHRLVAAAFIGPCPPGMEVRHLDSDYLNNRADNLRYGTKIENDADKRPGGSWMTCCAGHEYTEANTRIRTLANGGQARICRECQRRYRRENYARVASRKA